MRLGRRGVAALEFAIIAPVLLIMVIGVYDIVRALLIWQEVWQAAHDISLASTIVAVQPDQTNTLTQAQTQQVMSIVFAAMPGVRNGVDSGQRSLTLTSVAFLPTSGCNPSGSNNCYQADVVWSVTYGGGSQGGWKPVLRSCGVLGQILPNTTYLPGQTNLNTITTAGVGQPDPSLVADVQYRFSPLFLEFLTGPINFSATALFSTRTGTTTPTSSPYATYTGNDGTGTCAGFKSGYI